MRFLKLNLPLYVAVDADGSPGSGTKDGRRFAILFVDKEAVKAFTQANNLPSHPQVAILRDEAQVERCLRDSRNKGLEWCAICKLGEMEFFYIDLALDGFDGHPKAN